MFADTKQILREDQVDLLTRRELDVRFDEIRQLKGAIARYEARLVVAVDGLGDNGLDGAGVLRSRGRVSSTAAARSAKTATQLEQMPQTAKALDEGRITPEHADAVARAAEKTSPEQADEALIDEAAAAPADVFAKRSREWTNRQKRADDGTARHERQRRNRSGAHGVDTADGMWWFHFSLDPATGAQVKKALDTRVTELWRDDGGREAPPGTARTFEQRMADAFAELVAAPRRSKGPVHPRSQVNIGIDIAGLENADGVPLATLIDDGMPLPPAVKEQLACVSGLSIVLFDGPSRPIWVGRDHRDATIAQWRALIARDRGCVGCGAATDRCEAHHIIPWYPSGLTDIDNLVLVCSRCHHDIHHRGMVLRRRNGRWSIDPPGGPVVEPVESSAGRPPPGRRSSPPDRGEPPPGDRSRDDEEQLRIVA